MTISEARQELRDYQDNCKYLRRKREDIERLRSRLTNATIRLTGIPGAHNNRSFEEAAIILADVTNEHEGMFADSEQKRLTVERKINQLRQPYRNVLYLRYIRGLGWKEISKEMGYDQDYISRDHYGQRTATGIHGTALRLYADL